MAVHQIETIDGYVKYLQQTPAEVEALFRDLLIGVTSFFRDPEAFQALEEQVIPKLFAGKPAGARDPRLVAGLLHRRGGLFPRHPARRSGMEALKQSYKVQIFATDIDSQAIATARAGLYPASIAADISPERLARFFTAEPDGSAYRIHKGIRDMLVFSEQDVIKDPPFSKLDLISCRNLLIYHGRGAAEEAHSPVPLRAEPGRLSLPGHLGDRRRLRRSFCRAGPQSRSSISARRMSTAPARRPGPVRCRP